MNHIDNNHAICVLGIPNSGKTNLAVYLARQTSHETKYTLGYPKPIEGFKNLSSIDDLGQINDCVLLIDEFSKFFPLWTRKTNEKLLEMLQFAEHNNVKLILTTQFSQAITRQVEAMIPCYAVKRIIMSTLKNGSIVKDALKYKIKHPNLTSDYVKVEANEYVFYNVYGGIGESGIYTFSEQGIKKDWSNKS